ncbi:MAG: aminoacyl-tRNA hydrolase [Planctomycetaceae bacterium]|nr:aminoacyl-tRNA hydrolase [Planctomycetaceae bacterium]
MAERLMDMMKRLVGAGSLETKDSSGIKLIAGLGNPGAQYEQTRHNVGFMVIDAVAARFGKTISRHKFSGLIEELDDRGGRLLLLKPQQFMNRSGHAVAEAARFYKVGPDQILVITDDLALEVGRLRMRPQGSAGGHNGLKDIIASLGTDAFARLRVGIGSRGSRSGADYVLSRFAPDERSVIDEAAVTAAEAVLCWARDGVQAAMTRFNKMNNEE